MKAAQRQARAYSSSALHQIMSNPADAIGRQMQYIDIELDRDRAAGINTTEATLLLARAVLTLAATYLKVETTIK